MRHIFIVLRGALSVSLVTMALTACSGGGGGGSNFLAPAGMTTATISGAVSGTTFVAVDANSNAETGRVAASASTAGGEKTFSLPLPSGRTYKFYLIENEGTSAARLFPLYQGAANKFSISAITTIELGFIGTASGIALPANDMTKVGGVAAVGEDKTIPAPLASIAFSSVDLQGSWNVLQMVAGANPRWVQGKVDIDAGGIAPAGGYQSSAGSGTSPAAAYTITASGVVTFPSGTIGSFQGIMAKDKGLIVGTYTPNAGDFGLVMMVRSGGTYVQTDLQGTWSYNRLLTGAAQGWNRGNVAIDAAGAASFTGVVTNSGVGADSSNVLQIDAAGVITDPSNTNSYGVISQDKNLLFIVTTEVDGSVSITTLTRIGGATFSSSDFLGTWRMNWLTAGISSFWGRALLITDVAGDSTLRSMLLSYGTSSDSSIPMDFFTEGTVVIKSTDFGGILTLGKDVMIATKSDSGGFSLYLAVK